jgi:hypothetical protein
MHHQIQAGSKTSIEGLGKKKFQAMYGVNLETRIVQYQRDYVAQGGKLGARAGQGGTELPLLGVGATVGSGKRKAGPSGGNAGSEQA